MDFLEFSSAYPAYVRDDSLESQTTRALILRTLLPWLEKKKNDPRFSLVKRQIGILMRELSHGKMKIHNAEAWFRRETQSIQISQHLIGEQIQAIRHRLDGLVGRKRLFDETLHIIQGTQAGKKTSLQELKSLFAEQASEYQPIMRSIANILEDLVKITPYGNGLDKMSVAPHINRVIDSMKDSVYYEVFTVIAKTPRHAVKDYNLLSFLEWFAAKGREQYGEPFGAKELRNMVTHFNERARQMNLPVRMSVSVAAGKVQSIKYQGAYSSDRNSSAAPSSAVLPVGVQPVSSPLPVTAASTQEAVRDVTELKKALETLLKRYKDSAYYDFFVALSETPNLEITGEQLSAFRNRFQYELNDFVIACVVFTKKACRSGSPVCLKVSRAEGQLRRIWYTYESAHVSASSTQASPEQIPGKHLREDVQWYELLDYEFMKRQLEALLPFLKGRTEEIATYLFRQPKLCLTGTKEIEKFLADLQFVHSIMSPELHRNLRNYGVTFNIHARLQRNPLRMKIEVSYGDLAALRIGVVQVKV